MTPIPETAAFLAQRGPAALHLAGWLATASFLAVLLAIGDERRRAGSSPKRCARPDALAHRRCPRKPT